MERCCRNCRWEEIATLQHALCMHPLTIAMRQAANYNAVPFAFKELEVTYVKRNESINCPCFERKEA